METKPLTIDNLPIDASNRYAKDQKELDRGIIEGSKLFQSKPDTTAPATPYFRVEEGFSVGTLTRWATFTLPSDFAIHAARLYSYLLIPSLGTSDDLQETLDKLEALEKAVPQDKTPQYEYKTVHSLIKLLVDSSRTFDLIKGRCNQYHKG